MKKNKVIATAMASIALTGSLGSCGFLPEENVEEDVYGPPTPYEDPVEEPESESESEQEPQEEYDPAINVEPGVYGPPEAFD